MPIQCDIVTQERSVFSQEVDYVSLPGSEGVMGVLPNHVPMLTALAFGEVMVRNKGDEQYFAIGGGYAEIQPDRVIVLADSAERADEIDLERAETARAKAEKAMKTGVPEDAPRYAQIEAALKRAQIRINVGMRRSSRKRRAQMGSPDQSREEDQ
ncbi:MAG: F0F1 ATP synthase subunit epsilon [Candidatus Promineifilaceae bacterium]